EHRVGADQRRGEQDVGDEVADEVEHQVSFPTSLSVAVTFVNRQLAKALPCTTSSKAWPKMFPLWLVPWKAIVGASPVSSVSLAEICFTASPGGRAPAFSGAAL